MDLLKFKPNKKSTYGNEISNLLYLKQLHEQKKHNKNK